MEPRSSTLAPGARRDPPGAGRRDLDVGRGSTDQLTIRPLADGWSLEATDLEPLVFASGGPAERQARRLARSLAGLGHEARVDIYDARRRLAGSIRYAARRNPC